ncbi:MAG TPA: dihydrodipicolinate synthase family protein [Bryobacteraceae bacterium]|nr:dihydrodipicolinate synthase family protein [Bryobacteraceae bacterium]
MGWRETLQRGVAIPAHPLALTFQRNLDEPYQRALSRYYLAAGTGGIAVGVHTTQFAIRDAKVGLFRPVLELASEEARRSGRREEIVMVAGAVGLTKQAVGEAALARELGYDCVLLSLAALKDATLDAMIDHARAVAELMPVFGFYLQPAVGGRELPYAFWRRFAEIENVVAIKMAPFNRYQTLDVVRAVAESGRAKEIALYTGNDDNIVPDLITEFPVAGKRLRIIGGLLGHWACWTKSAVELLQRVHAAQPAEFPALLRTGVEVTDSNAAFFDAANRFHGCIAGIHEVLRRQGLLRGRWCLDANEDLSPGQMEEIDRVYASYPHLNDDEFVRQHLDEWLK